MKNQDIVLSVKKLNTSFISDRKEVRIVKDVSFDVRRASTLAVVGESGCGKSVTVHSIVRLMPKNARVRAESILYNQRRGDTVHPYELSTLAPYGKEMRALRGPDIGMVFQDPMSSLNPVYKVGDQVAEGLRQHHPGMKKEKTIQKILTMFKELGIPDPENRINDFPYQFSGGMKQRVVIAMALACSPKLLIADEPTTALDVTIQAQILAVMKGLKEKFGTSMIMITHDLGIVAGMCQKIAVMYAGKIVESGSVRDVISQPRHPYTRGLLAAVPGLAGGSVEDLATIPGRVPSPSEWGGGCTFAPRCSLAMPVCLATSPALLADADGHATACHAVNPPA